MFTLNYLAKSKQVLQRAQNIMTPSMNQFSFGGGHGLVQKSIQGRIKVTDHIVWINVVPIDGVPMRVAGFSGESLLQVIKRNNVPGLPADCKGGDTEMKPYQIPYDFYSYGVNCAQCQVIIPDPWFDKANIMVENESTRLLRSQNPQSSNSWLACCIQVRPVLNEMIVVIGNNKDMGGEWFTGHVADAF